MGRTLFSGDAGYRGVVQLGNGTFDAQLKQKVTTLLATGGSFTINHEPIFSQGVWGAGYQNAAEQVAYANNYLRLEGNFSFQLTQGEGLYCVDLFCFTRRGEPSGTRIVILPNGENGFDGYGWCSSLSFNASEGDVVSCDCDFQSYIDGMSTDPDARNRVITGISSNTALGISKGELPMARNGLYPYWATKVLYGPIDKTAEEANTILNDITTWRAEYSSEITPLKCCQQGSGSNIGQAAMDGQEAPLGPDYLLIGTMTGSGSYTVFRLQGDFEPEKYHTGRSLKFMMNASNEVGHGDKVANKDKTWIFIPTAINQNGTTSIQTGGQYITADFSFQAIGNGKEPPISLHTPFEDNSSSSVVEG